MSACHTRCIRVGTYLLSLKSQPTTQQTTLFVEPSINVLGSEPDIGFSFKSDVDNMGFGSIHHLHRRNSCHYSFMSKMHVNSHGNDWSCSSSCIPCKIITSAPPFHQNTHRNFVAFRGLNAGSTGGSCLATILSTRSHILFGLQSLSNIWEIQ